MDQVLLNCLDKLSRIPGEDKIVNQKIAVHTLLAYTKGSFPQFDPCNTDSNVFVAPMALIKKSMLHGHKGKNSLHLIRMQEFMWILSFFHKDESRRPMYYWPLGPVQARDAAMKAFKARQVVGTSLRSNHYAPVVSYSADTYTDRTLVRSLCRTGPGAFHGMLESVYGEHISVF